MHQVNFFIICSPFEICTLANQESPAWLKEEGIRVFNLDDDGLLIIFNITKDFFVNSAKHLGKNYENHIFGKSRKGLIYVNPSGHA